MRNSHNEEPAASLACWADQASAAAQKRSSTTTAPGAARVLRVYLVDDEPVIRIGLRSLLDRQRSFGVCGEAGGEEEAWKGILSTQPDLALVDLFLSQGSGVNLIRRLRTDCPGLKILVFSGSDQAELTVSALAAGAHGYLLKGEDTSHIMEAIHAVCTRGHYLSPEIVDRLVEDGGRCLHAGRRRTA